MVIFASTLCLVIPATVIVCAACMENFTMVVIGCILIALGLLLSKILTKIRIEARKAVEYDEFGLSKSKGHYERLSKAERNQIDLVNYPPPKGSGLVTAQS